MKHPFIETIPDVLKLHRPSMYEGESFTALEYVSKIAVKINECIAEFNSFATDISNLCEEYKDDYYDKQELFQRTMEQRFSDFIEVIKLKYASQDALLDEAISSMIGGMPDHIKEAINKMYSNGEFDAIVYDSIANLKRDFDSIVNNTNNFQNAINQSIANMTNSMEAFKGNINTSFEELGVELREEINRLANEAGIADMTKGVYDTNDDGVVNDSDKLGGQLPSYYAKQQDLDTANSMIDTVRNSLNAMPPQITVAQETANQAKETATTAKATAANALTEANKKLGKTEQASDSLRLNGQSASFYAPASTTFATYTHSKNGTVHVLNGSGSNIKFVSTAVFNKGDTFKVNDTTVSARTIDGKDLTASFFTSGNVVTCYLNGTVLNFNKGGAGNDLNIDVVGGTTEPVSPKENTVWVNTDIEITDWQLGMTEPTTRADGTPLQKGDVFIKISSAGNVTLNISTKNAIVISLIYAYQWNGTKYVAKEMKMYANNQWYIVNIMFYDGGVQFVPWEVKRNANGKATFSNSYIELRATSTSFDSGITIGTVNKVNFDNIDSIIFNATTISRSAASNFTTSFIIDDDLSSKRPNLSEWSPIARLIVTSANTKKDFTIDTSKIKGKHYIGVGIDTGMSQSTDPIYIYSCKAD